MKGQSSIEFFVYFALTLTVFSFLYVEMVDRQISMFDYRETSLATNIGEKYGFEVENAVKAGEGYEREIDLPSQIFGSNYNVTANEGVVLVEWDRDTTVVSTNYAGEEVKISSEEDSLKVKNNGSVHVVSR